MTQTLTTNAAIPKAMRIPVLKLLAGAVAVIVPVAVVQLSIAALPVSRLVRDILLGLVTPAVAMGAYVAFVRWAERRVATELLPKIGWKHLILGLMLGTTLFGLTISVLALVGAYRAVGANGWEVIVIPAMISLSSGFFEEILFRGVFFRIVEEGLGSWLALVISAAVFGGLHLLNENAGLQGAIAVMLTAGILLAATFMLTRRLWLAIGIHIAANFTQAGVFGLPVSGNRPLPGLAQSALQGPAWLTGGEFGVEASVILVMLGVIVSVFLLWRTSREGRIVPAPWHRPRN